MPPFLQRTAPLLALLAWSGPAGPTAEADTRPNILLIITDDQRRAEFNFLPEGRDERGNPKNLCPNIDRLAAEGVVFLNQYVSSPVCTPSRYSVLTGTYASRSPTFARAARSGEQINITWNSHIDHETPNVARTLQRAGYFTGAVGKNHVIKLKSKGRETEAPADDADPKRPEIAAYYAAKQQEQVVFFKACGFDFAASLYAGNLPGHTCQALEYHNMDWITSGALEFLDEWKYLAFRLPPSLPPNPPRPYTHLADRPGGRGSEGPAMTFYPNYYDRDQLYNIGADPFERRNLYQDAHLEDRVQTMRRLLREAVANVPGTFAEFTDPVK